MAIKGYKIGVTRGGRGRSCKIVDGGKPRKGAVVSISDVKQCAATCGSHWFDPGAMRFFNSRPSDRAYTDGRGGAIFTSSEKGPDGVRRFSTKAQADKVAQRIAAKGKKLRE